MARTRIEPGPPATAQEQRLEQLEAVIAAGLIARTERNRLLWEMSEGGYRQVDLMRRLNRVRAAHGVPELTPDAVAVVIKRFQDFSENA